MANDRDDVTPKANTYRRIEVIAGIERRRRWSDDEKLAIIAESYATRISIFGRGPAARPQSKPAIPMASPVS